MNIFQTFQYATLYDASYNVIHVVDPDVILLQLDDLVYTPHMHVTQCTWIMKTIELTIKLRHNGETVYMSLGIEGMIQDLLDMVRVTC